MRSIATVWLITFFALANLSGLHQPAHVAQGAAPITLSAYWELVGSTRQAIAKMDASPAEEIRHQLDDLAGGWEKVTAVEFPDQSMMTVDSAYLTAELRIDPPDLKHLGKLLDALLDAHEKYPQKVFTIQDLEPLKQVLARPEFQWAQPNVVETPNWLQKIYDAFANFMDRLLFGIQNTLYYGRVPLTILSVFIFFVSLYFISSNLSRNLVRDAQLAAEDGDGDDLLTSKGAIQRAQALSSQGDYRNAIRYLYLSSLLVLDERGLMRYDRSRTNREYLRSVSSKPELEKPLHSVIDVFDRVWYGFENVDETTFETYLADVEELRERKE